MIKLYFLIASISLCGFGYRTLYGQQDFDRLKPLTGLWKTQRPDGDICEQWSRRSATELTGRSYQVSGSDTTELETMRLYLSQGAIIYAPVTAGENPDKPVLFKLKSVRGNTFFFENPGHDFPTRIVYHLKSADRVDAYIEGQIGKTAKRIDYPYTRIK